MTEPTAPTEALEPPVTTTEPAPGWGAPMWGAPAPAQAPTMDDDEPFVPAPRYRLGRFTKILVCVCLVLAGALGGAAIQKAVDTRTGGTTRGNFAQFTPGGGAGQTGAGTGAGTGQSGAGTGQNGGFGRNRATQGGGAGSGAGGN
ncbi:hypothetical protein [Sinomonas sp.]|uniref:hypothetical protein n=1 Tax=Sinomonas sp. TaxID=1914986 RepID=UPI003F820E99